MRTLRVIDWAIAAMLVGIFGLSLALLAGCRTASRQVVVSPGVTNLVIVEELDPLAGDAITGVLAIGVPYAVEADANSAAYLQLTAGVFRVAADSGQYDPALVNAALGKISVKELQDPIAAKLIGTVFRAYKASYADAVNSKLDQTKWGPFVKDLLLAIAQGIEGGLAP